MIEELSGWYAVRCVFRTGWAADGNPAGTTSYQDYLDAFFDTGREHQGGARP